MVKTKVEDNFLNFDEISKLWVWEPKMSCWVLSEVLTGTVFFFNSTCKKKKKKLWIGQAHCISPTIPEMIKQYTKKMRHCLYLTSISMVLNYLSTSYHCYARQLCFILASKSYLRREVVLKLTDLCCIFSGREYVQG